MIKTFYTANNENATKYQSLYFDETIGDHVTDVIQTKSTRNQLCNNTATINDVFALVFWQNRSNRFINSNLSYFISTSIFVKFLSVNRAR